MATALTTTRIRQILHAGSRVALLALTVALVSGEANAISRYTSTALNCAAIQTKVQGEGEVILRWTQPPDILRYGRYVAHSGYCDYGERAKSSPVPAADQARCPVLECKQFDPQPLSDLFNFGPR